MKPVTTRPTTILPVQPSRGPTVVRKRRVRRPGTHPIVRSPDRAWRQPQRAAKSLGKRAEMEAIFSDKSEHPWPSPQAPKRGT
jgi:hypothetical protein